MTLFSSQLIYLDGRCMPQRHAFRYYRCPVTARSVHPLQGANGEHHPLMIQDLSQVIRRHTAVKTAKEIDAEQPSPAWIIWHNSESSCRRAAR